MAEKEYIEREAVLTYMSEVKAACISNFEYEASAVIAGMIGEIKDDEIPAADVAPVKHGHFRRLTFSGDTIICSECKMAYNIFETNGAENFNFCPHCGAKIMDGGEQK